MAADAAQPCKGACARTGHRCTTSCPYHNMDMSAQPERVLSCMMRMRPHVCSICQRKSRGQRYMQNEAWKGYAPWHGGTGVSTAATNGHNLHAAATSW